MDRKVGITAQKDGQKELVKLLEWITENREKWQYICNPEFMELPIEEKLELMECLEEAGLYLVAYVVFSSNWSKSCSMEAVRDQFVNELIAEMQPEQLIEKMKKSMQRFAVEQPKE